MFSNVFKSDTNWTKQFNIAIAEKDQPEPEIQKSEPLSKEAENKPKRPQIKT